MINENFVLHINRDFVVVRHFDEKLFQMKSNCKKREKADPRIDILNTIVFTMTQDPTLEEKVEYISINDSTPEEQGPVVPHERQIVDQVITIWKEDPATENLGVPKLHAIVKQKHPNWTVSEKRVKQLLKKFGLLTNQEQYTYAKDIKSELTPDIELPPKVQVVMTSKRGKCLYAKKPINKGELIWSETPLFFVPPLANVHLVEHGSACANCGILLQQTEMKTVLKGLDCDVCSEVWCSKKCKQMDAQLHGATKHNVFNPNAKKPKIIDSNAFLELQEYCLKESWNALYAITLICANMLLDKLGTKQKQFNAMARVSQDVRYKALDSGGGTFDNMNGGALFVQEQQETLWKEGYERFLRVFPKNFVSYKDFLYMMGTYNINNLDSNVFLTQSHLNHNCDPNTTVDTALDRISGLKVFAKRDIKEGEELTTTYVNPSHTLNQRQRELRVNWGFICACEKCKSDARTTERRKSSSSSKKQDAKNIRNMLKETKEQVGDGGIELEIPHEVNGERRKSVRFDETVVAVNN